MFLNKLKLVIISLANIFNLDSAPFEEVKIIDYGTEYVYSEKYAEGEELVITNGENGYSHFVDGKIVNEKEPINQVLQVGTRKNVDYTGVLTGYGPDCPGCNSEGYVACKTEEKTWWSLVNDGVIYNDDDYGKVNIVAADVRLFPCGTIIEINNSKYKNLLAIVLDTGYTMRRQWRTNKTVHLDLAFDTEKGTNAVTNKKTNYHIKRWGW